jgi:4-alpha-glucanotransferase
LPEELAKTAAERAALLALLCDEGLLGRDEAGDREEVNLALHRLLVASPARLIAAALGDAVGDLRQPNLPGTRDEYPNWRLPLADDHGRPVTLEMLQSDPRVRRLIRVLAEVLDPAPNIGR